MTPVALAKPPPLDFKLTHYPDIDALDSFAGL